MVLSEMQKKCVLTVGFRKGAFQALARMGWSVVLVNPTPPPAAFGDMVKTWIPEDGQGWDELVPKILAACREDEIHGVLALTEGSVGPAAAIRRGLDLPGIDPETAKVCRDKIAMKSFFREKGVAVTDWLFIGPQTKTEELVDLLGLPMVIKQRDSSGSRGLTIAKTLNEVRAYAFPGLMAERFIRGEEMSVESFIGDRRILLVNPTEYAEPLWVNIVPRQMEDAPFREVMELNRTVLEALQLDRCMTHLELFCTKDGPVLGEIALRPPGGHLMELLRLAYGLDFWEVFIRLECGLSVSLPQKHTHYAGVRILHPGPGRYRRVHGVEEACSLNGVVGVHARVKKEMIIPVREGSGQEAGHILARGASRTDILESLNRARDIIHFEKADDTPGSPS